MPLRIGYRTGLFLGCLGWLLATLPAAIAIGVQIASGAPPRTMIGGAAMVGVAGVLFVAALYLEEAGKLPALQRRMVCGMAAALLATWVMRALGALGFIAWFPLMAIFTIRAAPLRSRVAEIAAGMIVVATLAGQCFYVAGFLSLATFTWRWAATVALQFIPTAMILVFALSVRQQAVLSRRGETQS